MNLSENSTSFNMISEIWDLEETPVVRMNRFEIPQGFSTESRSPSLDLVEDRVLK